MKWTINWQLRVQQAINVQEAKKKQAEIIERQREQKEERDAERKRKREEKENKKQVRLVERQFKLQKAQEE